MKAAPHPALANTKVCHVGDPVAVVIAETLDQARDAAEKVKVDYGVLPAIVDPAQAQRAGAPQIHEVAPNNTIYQWHIGDPAATDAAFKTAAHVTKLDIINNRLIPNAIEPRAALADYDSGTETLTLWNTSQNPHVARLVIAAFRRHGAGEQAACDRARRRRRLWFENLYLSRRGRVALGLETDRTSGEMGFRPVGSVSRRRTWTRPRYARRIGAGCCR